MRSVHAEEAVGIVTRIFNRAGTTMYSCRISFPQRDLEVRGAMEDGFAPEIGQEVRIIRLRGHFFTSMFDIRRRAKGMALNTLLLFALFLMWAIFRQW